MENAARRKWLAFRQYKFKGVAIEQSPERVRFKQKVPYFERKPNKPFKVARVILILTWLALSALVFASAGMAPGLTALGLGFLAMAVVMVLVSLIFPVVIIVDVLPSMLRIDDGYTQTDLTVEDIQNVDVQGGPKKFTVYVWRGPIPIETLSQETQHNAIALREGLMAAIAMMNNLEIEDDVITPGEMSPPPQRRKTFEEEDFSL